MVFGSKTLLFGSLDPSCNTWKKNFYRDWFPTTDIPHLKIFSIVTTTAQFMPPAGTPTLNPRCKPKTLQEASWLQVSPLIFNYPSSNSILSSIPFIPYSFTPLRNKTLATLEKSHPSCCQDISAGILIVNPQPYRGRAASIWRRPAA